MYKHLKRLALAFVISLASLVSTLGWYYAGLKPHSTEVHSSSVARLTESTDEVQRKEAHRVMWETVSLNDDLFTGEAIRTGAKASARVLLKTGAVIVLDPDSLVILEQNEKGLALDFLEGNLFIQGGTASAADQLRLKTGQGELTMTGADVSVTRARSGEVDLEVHRGQLELTQNGKVSALGPDKAATLSQSGLNERGGQLRLTAPRAGDTVSLNLSKGEKLELAWPPLPAGHTVFVDVGSRRSTLVRRAGPGFDGAAGRATISITPGQWFVRLTARAPDQTEVASLVTLLRVVPRVAPTLIEPSANASLPRLTPDQVTRFAWMNRNAFDQQTFEVASDAAFRKVIRRQNVAGDVLTTSFKLPDGTYFWRVTGFANQRSLSSDGQRFGVGLKLEERVAATPPARLEFASSVDQEYTTDAPALAAEWTALKAARYQYRVASSAEVLATTAWTPVTQNRFRVAVPADGEYAVSVEARDDKDQLVAASEIKTFRVKARPRLAAPNWTGGGAKMASDARGNATLTWDPVEGARGYKVEMTDPRGQRRETDVTRGPAAFTGLAPGEYVIKVRSIDDLNRTGELGSPRRLVVPDASDIAAPKIKAFKIK